MNRRWSLSTVPWHGLSRHLVLTLRLNFRSRPPLIYGYLVPVFFLLAFGSVFRSATPPLLHEMGQILTITVLGGACFGLPTTVVAERERGVWRRYRLLPFSSMGLVLSASVARLVLVASGAVLQIVLAWAIYHTPFPAHPLELAAAFGAVAFAFLGLGWMIAALADSVPAVQALGQAVFLPMILIGGVGVPLRTLPSWAQRVAGFLPGRYAVEALNACLLPEGGGLARAGFALAALGIIGTAAFVAASGLFRWDAGPRPLQRQARGWITFALAAWIGVGLAAGWRRPVANGEKKHHRFPASQPEPWRALTDADINAMRYDDLPPDDGYLLPLAANGATPDEGGAVRLDGLRELLARWQPGTDAVADASQRVRNLLSVCAAADLSMDRDEAKIARLAFEQVKLAVRDPAARRQVLAWIALHPEQGIVWMDASEFGIIAGAQEPFVRDRVSGYARKLLRETRL